MRKALVFALLLAGCSHTPPQPAPPIAKETPPRPSKPVKLYPIKGSPGVYRDALGNQMDLRGFPSGYEVKDPYTGRVYVVP